MKKHGFTKWLSHPTYFLFWLAVGFFAWNFSYDKPSETGVVQLSSTDDGDSQAVIDAYNQAIAETNAEELDTMTDEQLLEQMLKASEQYDFSKEKNPYAVDPAIVEGLDKKLENSDESSDQYFNYENIAGDEIKSGFEDPKKCSGDRLNYEKQILATAKLKSWMKPRSEKDQSKLLMKCVTHVMNTVTLPRSNYASCPKATGGIRRGAGKPCVTETMVSVTYNSYTDVMDCLNLNPKDIFPKISGESGFALNAYGAKGDGGIGQLTGIAIEEVNKVYDAYMTQIFAATKPSCARIAQDKTLREKAPHNPLQRCSLIAVPENPLKNLLYTAILNRMNMDRISGISFIKGTDYLERNGHLAEVKNDSSDEFQGIFKKYQFAEKLEKLKVKNANLHFFKDILAYAGYNMGAPTSVKLFDQYLSKRLGLRSITAKERDERIKQGKEAASPYYFDENENYPKALKTSMKDFDFNNTALAIDVDGKQKDVVTIARLQVNSSIKKSDKQDVKLLKVKRRKELPKHWVVAHTKTFAEYLAYRANDYDGKSVAPITMSGTPGYLNLVTEKNKAVRKLFHGAGIDPDYCSNPNFLKSE